MAFTSLSTGVAFTSLSTGLAFTSLSTSTGVVFYQSEYWGVILPV